MADPVMLIRAYLKKPEDVTIANGKISFGKQHTYDLTEQALTLADKTYSFGEAWFLAQDPKKYLRIRKDFGLRHFPREERKRLEELFKNDSVGFSIFFLSFSSIYMY